MKDPYLATEWVDQATGAKGYFVIDEMKNDFCAGGIRMRKGVTKKEVERLARIMTIKMAGLGVPLGGAKGGIDFPSDHPKSKEVLKRYLKAHIPYIREYWLTSEDLGTKEEDILTILRDLGLKSSVHAFINKQENSAILTEKLQRAMSANYDGMKLTDLVTGYGVAVVTLEGLNHLEIKRNHAKVSIQGFGSVGASAAKFLFENGVKIVAIADWKGTIYCKDGLDIPLLSGLKDNTGMISRNGLPPEYEQLPGNAWLTVHSDVLIPAAVADVIHADNAGDLNVKLIIEGANLPVTSEAEQLLFEHDIMVIPDFIANSGGAGLFVSILYGDVKGEASEIFTFLREQMSETTKRILDIAKKDQLSPRIAAKQLVDRLEQQTKQGV
ncbi:Glu/Leu/Phe/Val family dehydrogenase [Bacillus norwichensis]|uniref:Glutamate dehydrogenase n=1 Tax=Bacillus norwichensis TaxID=2762217 RepID=A0ABR8VNC8_9BACI|nr:Glu/Leu/Phe/Val dehydrogenase dimerization domain-containing protein [Bacillus norwichensis]MBD8005961.1 glutamate dehydrogenase [Bacillus norwichensis]